MIFFVVSSNLAILVVSNEIGLSENQTWHPKLQIQIKNIKRPHIEGAFNGLFMIV